MTPIILSDSARQPCGRIFFSGASWALHAYALTPRNVRRGRFPARQCGGRQHGRHDRGSSTDIGHLAHAAGHHRLRLRDCAAEFWPALQPRFLRAADGPRIRLGPRRVRPCHRVAEPAVGPRPADRRRHCRPLRAAARDVRRRLAVRCRPAADALLDHVLVARHQRRRADRFRPVGLVVQSGAGRVQQAVAA